MSENVADSHELINYEIGSKGAECSRINLMLEVTGSFVTLGLNEMVSVLVSTLCVLNSGRIKGFTSSFNVVLLLGFECKQSIHLQMGMLDCVHQNLLKLRTPYILVTALFYLSSAAVC